MTKRDFNEFCDELEDIIDSYLNDEAWEITTKWFNNGSGEIIIEYDVDEIDWDIVDEDWESDCEDDINELEQEWGGRRDWDGCQIKWGFNLD